MNQPSDVVVFPELLTVEEQRAFQALAAADPALAEAVSFWRRARVGVGESLDRLVPDRGLLVCYALEQSGAADLLDSAEVEALAAARPGLEEALRRYPALADAVRRIQEDAAGFDTLWSEQFSAEPAGLRAPRRDREPVAHTPERKRRARWAWRVAVGVTLAAFMGILVMVARRDGSFEVVRTGSGETRVVELADGSVVRLLEHSELAYVGPEAEGVSARRTKLKGRAYFEVAASREVFTVETATAVTTVLGTTFGVAADEDVTEVILATGRVALAPKAAPARMVTLEPGEASRVAEGALPSTPEAVDVPEALAWTGLFVFNTTSLTTIAEVLEAHYGVPVSVAGVLEDEEITGTFERQRRIEEILTPLAATLGVQLEGDARAGYRLAPGE